jgi:hypothetical protein
LGRTFLWWYWALYFFLKVFGFDLFYSIFIAIACLATICLTYGFFRARELARAALQANAPLSTSAQANLSSSSQPAPAAWRRVPTNSMAPASITVPDSIVANRVLSIYHLHDCQWAGQILPRNRVAFASASEAVSAGYKPCQICLPSS